MATEAIFAVRLDAFLRVKSFVSTEYTRYYLNGIFIDNAGENGAVCVATDDHRLGIRRDAEGIVMRPTIVRVARELASWKPEGKLLGSPWLVGHSTGDATGFVSIVEPAPDADGNDTAAHAIARADECVIRIGRAFVDGTFPEWRRVVPQTAEGAIQRTFNADYLKAFTTKTSKLATMAGASADAPHLVRLAGDPDFVGVLMPARADDISVPDWITAAKPDNTKKAA